MQVLRELREGAFDVLVGVNLLREGLDLPEVSLVAILDADKEGFLRSRNVADPDDRPGRPQRQRRGDPVRRQGDRFDAAEPSTRRIAAATCNCSTTPSTASRRRRCVSAINMGIEEEIAAHKFVQEVAGEGGELRDRGISGGTARRNAGGGGEPGIRGAAELRDRIAN